MRHYISKYVLSLFCLSLCLTASPSVAEFIWNDDLTSSGSDTITGSAGNVGITIEDIQNHVIKLTSMVNKDAFPQNYKITQIKTLKETKGSTYEIRFAQPVNNPIIAVASLGNGSRANRFTFDRVNGTSGADVNFVFADAYGQVSTALGNGTIGNMTSYGKNTYGTSGGIGTDKDSTGALRNLHLTHVTFYESKEGNIIARVNATAVNSIRFSLMEAENYMTLMVGYDSEASPSQSQISIASHIVPASGIATSMVTVQVVDDYGNIYEKGGDTVTIASSLGTVSNVTDNGDGTYSATVRSAIVGTATISATVNGSPITSSFTNGINFTALTADFANATSSTNESSTAASVQVDLSTAASFNVDIAYSVSGSASAGSDYTAPSGTVTIPAGATSANIALTGIVDDALFEGDETIEIQLTSATNATIGTDNTHVHSLIDNDPGPSISVDTSASVWEGSDLAIPVKLSHVSGLDITFNYATSDIAAFYDFDYTALSGTATIPAGQTQTIITLSTLANDIDEIDRDLSFKISNFTPATVTSSATTQTIDILDEDGTISIGDVAVHEGDSTAHFPVTLEGPLTSNQVTLDFTTAANTAGAPDDFTAQSGQLTFTDSATQPPYFASPVTKDIMIALTDDTLFEGGENFTLQLSNIQTTGTVELTDASGTASITDNETTPTIQFNTASSNGSESQATPNLQVDLSHASTKDITVQYMISGTATGGGTDHNLGNGTLTIPALSTSASITIPAIIDDVFFEGDETIIITLTSPTEATLGATTTHRYTITDNETVPKISFTSPSSNASESVQTSTIPLTLTTASATDVTVQYTISGTASGGGTDHNFSDGMLTIPALATSTQITLSNIIDDSIFESDETILITLSSPSGATLGTTPSHVYTITDNEPTPEIEFTNPNSSIAESVSSTTIPLTLTTASATDIIVQYMVSGTASGGGTDHNLGDGSLTIPALSTTAQITIPAIIDDSIFESDETILITLSSPSGATLGTTATHIMTLTDNETAPEIQFNSATSSGSESLPTPSLQLDLTTASATDIIVQYMVSGTATGGGTDHALGNGSLTIPALSTSTSLTIPNIIDDSIAEPDETILITLTTPTGATLGTTATHEYTIIDNESAPMVQFASPNSSGLESISSASLQIDLSTASATDVTVQYTISGTATGGGTDHALGNGTLTIPALSTSTQITIPGIIDDSIFESDETILITLSSPTGATLGATSSHAYSITDNEPMPKLAFTNPSSSIAESASSTTIPLTLTTASATDITVQYMVTGTASGGGTDHNLGDGTLTIPALSTSASITIPGIIDDSIFESDETILITLSSPSGATLGTQTTHTATISDNEPTPKIAFTTASTSISESTPNTTIPLTLTGASATDITVQYMVSGTATAGGTDHNLSDGTLTIPALTTSASLTIPGIIDDSIAEPDETIIITLASPSGATLGTQATQHRHSQ